MAFGMNDATARRTALVVVCLSSFITPLMLSSVNVAVPAIADGLRADAVATSWIATAYLLASSVFLLPFGRLADMHGRKRFFLAGMIVVSVASLLAGTAGSIEVLLAWRALQGVGAAMLFGTGVAILSAVYPRERRGGVIGISASAVYLGLTCGPLFGGWVVHTLGWRYVFVYHVPFTVVAIYLILTRLEGEWADGRGESFDLIGAAIYATAIVTLMYGISRLPAPTAYGLLLLGVLGLAAFVRFERGRTHPVFDVSLFFNNQVFACSCSAALLMYSAVFANSFLMSLYLQNLRGMSANAAGMVLMAQPVVQMVLSPAAGRLSDRFEPRVVASAGAAITVIGLVLLARLDDASTLATVIVSLMTVGLGFGLFSSPNVNAIMSAVEPRQFGLAGGSMATVRVLGQMSSMAVATVVLTLVMGRVQIAPAYHDSLARSISLCFVVAAALAGVGIALSLARGRMHPPRSP
ncbi:MAG: MFS transporter [Gammaproteobacteria bacterium]|nr:MFS transporter [Gammaproteobacteria bacterium]